MGKKKSTFWPDFKKFITRGNVVDMAVAVIIGAAFNKIVTGLVNMIINPFIGIFMKKGSLDTVKTVITPAVLDEAGNVTSAEVAILWGQWLQTIIDFLIVAFCLFLIIRVIMNVKKVMEAKETAEKEAADKAAKEKADAEKAAADAALAEKEAALAEKQAKMDASIMAQEKLLAEIRDILKNK